MEVAGSQALGAMTSVLQALDTLPGDDWEDEDEETYYSDEEGDEEVSPDLAGRGIGECGRVQPRVAVEESCAGRLVGEISRMGERYWGGWGQQRSRSGRDA